LRFIGKEEIITILLKNEEWNGTRSRKEEVEEKHV